MIIKNSNITGENSLNIATEKLLFALIVVAWIVVPFVAQIHEGPATEIIVLLTLLVVGILVVMDKGSVPKSEFIVLLSYSLSLLLVLLFATSFSLDPIYSGLRVVINVILLVFLYFAISPLANEMMKGRSEPIILINNFLIAFYAFIFIGALIWPSFVGGPGGIRLTAGVNANAVGFMGMMTLIWLHLNSAISDQWGKSDKILLFCAFLAVFWSMSRGVIVSVAIFYFLISCCYMLRMFARRMFGKQHMYLLFFLLVLTISVAVIIFQWDRLTETYAWFSYIERRMNVQGDENLGSRQAAWQFLLSFYHGNELLGSAGWYNATNVLDTFSPLANVASSPHNLYVRLLSEVGLIGALFVLLLPIYAFLYALLQLMNYASSPHDCLFKTLSVIAAALVAVFAREMVEDSYMTSYVNITTALVILLLLLTTRVARNIK